MEIPQPIHPKLEGGGGCDTLNPQDWCLCTSQLEPPVKSQVPVSPGIWSPLKVIQGIN